MSRPCSEHFQKLNGNSLCLPCWVRRRCGVEKRLADALIPGRAWPSCTEITIFEGRRRWRCDHVPIVSKGNGDALFRYIKKNLKASSPFFYFGKIKKKEREEEKEWNNPGGGGARRGSWRESVRASHGSAAAPLTAVRACVRLSAAPRSGLPEYQLLEHFTSKAAELVRD